MDIMKKQELEIKKEVIKVGKKEILKFTLRRVDEGIRLWFKSEDFEKFFKRFGIDKHLESINGNKSYKVPTNLGSTYKSMFMLWDHSLFNNETINLSYILSENLSKGIIFIDKGVYTKNELTHYRDEFLKYVTLFYKEYMKPVSFDISVISNGDKN